MCWLAIIFFSTTVNSVPGAWQSSEGSSAWITNAPNSPQIKGMEVPLPSPTTTPCASTDKRSCRLIWRGMKMGIFGSVGSAFCSPPSAEQGILSITRSKQRYNELQEHTSRMSLQVAFRFMSKMLGKNCWK